jgi:glycerol-3-phosphate dehydrogenase (NAD(P)+)
MTRGLNEMRKLAAACGCNPETLNGLSGMGDLCVTCSSMISRNYRFGYLIAEGIPIEEAKEKIGMVVEGLYTCVSALQVSKEHSVAMPISEAVYQVVVEGLKPVQAVEMLMTREIKEEFL